MIDICIPFSIIRETIEYDNETDTFKIDRVYRIPKATIFVSPNKYALEFIEYDNAKWQEKDFIVYTFLTGWHDADCRSFGMKIMLQPLSGHRKVNHDNYNNIILVDSNWSVNRICNFVLFCVVSRKNNTQRRYVGHWLQQWLEMRNRVCENESRGW